MPVPPLVPAGCGSARLCEQDRFGLPASVRGSVGSFCSISGSGGGYMVLVLPVTVILVTRNYRMTTGNRFSAPTQRPLHACPNCPAAGLFWTHAPLSWDRWGGNIGSCCVPKASRPPMALAQ